MQVCILSNKHSLRQDILLHGLLYSHIAIVKIAKEFPSFMVIICLQDEIFSVLSLAD